MWKTRLSRPSAVIQAHTREGRGETVLLVEDDPSILKMATKMLEMEGYSVLVANTAADAINCAEQHPGEIHLLLTDVVMPGMNGRELSSRMRQIRPALKCLCMSGYTANVIAHHRVLDAGIQFIQKPFSKQELAKKVREILDGGAESNISIPGQMG